MTRRALLRATALMLGGGWAGWRLQAAVPLPPVITSDWEITCLLPDGGGVWVGTSGGITRIEAGGRQARYTRADGLPAHETRHLVKTPSGVRAVFAAGAAEWRSSAWAPTSLPPAPNAARSPLPPGAAGTHVTARTRSGPDEIVAVWGDARWYRRRGAAWKAEPSGLPSGIGEQITALAADGSTLWAGTRRAGLWRRNGSRWRQVTTAGTTPLGHNAQAIARYGGRLWISTLDDGLMAWDGRRWEALKPPHLSSDAPRQMVVFQNRLYVREGGGAVDCWDGSTWTRDVFRAHLPRRHASTLHVGGGRLWIGVWGGFSGWDGQTWAHHAGQKELAGVPITALRATDDRKTLWVGTQGRGLCEADAQTGNVRRFHDERAGLPDDWVTEIARGADGRLWVGTFVGGLACLLMDTERFALASETTGENVTGIVPRGNGAWAATRRGLRSVGTESPSLPYVTGTDVEAQCLFADETGVWVGTRTGIYHLRPGEGR